MLETTANFTDGERSIQATAIVGVDLNQKGMQTSQQFGAASTYGKKYALGNLLLIDDTEDADASNKHGKDSTVLDKLKASMPKNQRLLLINLKRQKNIYKMEENSQRLKQSMLSLKAGRSIRRS